jgi:hypothetical protein
MKTLKLSRCVVGIAGSLSLAALSLGGCVVEDADGSVDEDGTSTAEEALSRITHVASTSDYAHSGAINIRRPSSQSGDLLVLALMRTDDYLPLRLSGWRKAAECFKQDNGYDCYKESDCREWSDANYCRYFGSGTHTGRDLAQVIFYKTVSSSEPSSYAWSLRGSHPAWAIMSTLRGASTSNPVRAWASKGCDDNTDSLFPATTGNAGDMLLLSQAFDDYVTQDKFNPPTGTSLFRYQGADESPRDEAGFVFGKLLTSTGSTGQQKTHGEGGSACKDALISLTIKPQ